MPKCSYVSKCVCGCVCVSMCLWASCLAKAGKLQMGTQPRHWISTISPCSSAGGTNVMSISQLSKRVTLTLQFLHHISDVHRRSTELPWRGHVVPPQLYDKVGHWCWEQKILHNCPEWDIPSAPPSLSLSLLLSNFTAGPGPIESQVSCRDKQIYCPIEALLPFIACKREAWFQLRPQPLLSNYFTTLFCSSFINFVP